MVDVALEVEVSIYFKMVLRLFILSFYECSKIGHLYPLKFLVVMFSLLFYKVLHLDRKCLESLTALSWGKGRKLPFIAGYKKFITSHKIFTLPIILTFIKIRHMHKTQSTLHERSQRLYRKKRRLDIKPDNCIT